MGRWKTQRSCCPFQRVGFSSISFDKSISKRSLSPDYISDDVVYLQIALTEGFSDAAIGKTRRSAQTFSKSKMGDVKVVTRMKNVFYRVKKIRKIKQTDQSISLWHGVIKERATNSLENELYVFGHQQST